MATVFRGRNDPSASRLGENISAAAGTSLSGCCEHGVATGCIGGRNLLLHHIPMFHALSVRKAADIDGNHRLRSPAVIAPMYHDEVAIRDGHARFIGKACEGRDHGGYG